MAGHLRLERLQHLLALLALAVPVQPHPSLALLSLMQAAVVVGQQPWELLGLVALVVAGREPTQIHPQRLELLTQAAVVVVVELTQQAAQMAAQAVQA